MSQSIVTFFYAFFMNNSYMYCIKKNYICHMKFLCSGFLILFITFLATPTLIGFVDEEVNTSYFYNMCEEEENHVPFNEIKSLPSNNFSFLNLDTEEKQQFDICSKFDVQFFNLAHQIFSPPPNMI